MKGYIRLPLELFEREGMKKSTALVLGVIIDRCTDTEVPTSIISQAYIREATGLSGKSVKNALQELKKMELIETKRTGRASIYTLTGAVTILPPKQRDEDKAPPIRKRTKKRKSLTEEEMREMDEYLSLVNRFIS